MNGRTINRMMAAGCAGALALAATALADNPKYVFFFLGDGMSQAQIQCTEAYLTVVNGGSATLAEDLLKPENRLNMSKMPVAGLQTTYDSHALMTDSASAGTAFACGVKTRSGQIGVSSDLTKRYKSVAQLARESGKKVGIVTSVSLDHATPASYYASVPNRGLMNNIASQMAATGYEFFGGGGLVAPTGPARGGDTANNVWELLAANGYTVLSDRPSIEALKTQPKDRVVCINPWLQDAAAMPYDIDRPDTNLSLKEMVEVAIACLYGDGNGKARAKGFFLAVEGGKIDWACHANDAMATIGDVLDFDDAVGVALEFLRKHPRETLVVVTGDHETGGMSVGHATTAYTAYYDRLLGQTCSFQKFSAEFWPAHESAYEAGYDWTKNNLASGDPDAVAFAALMENCFGLTISQLNPFQKQKLEDAYDWSMAEVNDNLSDENKLLYGGYEAITVTITHLLNERASIGWTSYSHTAVPVPVFAKGQDAFAFAGFYDNTDIAKTLAVIMGIRQPLPIEK